MRERRQHFIAEKLGRQHVDRLADRLDQRRAIALARQCEAIQTLGQLDEPIRAEEAGALLRARADETEAEVAERLGLEPRARIGRAELALVREDCRWDVAARRGQGQCELGREGGRQRAVEDDVEEQVQLIRVEDVRLETAPSTRSRDRRRTLAMRQSPLAALLDWRRCPIRGPCCRATAA